VCRRGRGAPRSLPQVSWVWACWMPRRQKQGRHEWVLAVAVVVMVALSTKMVWLGQLAEMNLKPIRPGWCSCLVYSSHTMSATKL
jgi:hypothetical protein